TRLRRLALEQLVSLLLEGLSEPYKPIPADIGREPGLAPQLPCKGEQTRDKLRGVVRHGADLPTAARYCVTGPAFASTCTTATGVHDAVTRRAPSSSGYQHRCRDPQARPFFRRQVRQ